MSITTRVISVDPHRPDPEAIWEAQKVLRRGDLVAFATETVYGLGADATNPKAVARIFAAKGRPSINPLIVHASDTAMARRVVLDWPETAEKLATAFWPGPLTLVLPRAEIIPDIVTAGRDTVAVRVPKTEVARLLLIYTGRPIAAPSANRSAGTSSTLARHVLDDLEGRIDLLLDSGQTTLGLESTVLDLTTRRPHLLRPGPIGVREIERILCGELVHSPVDPDPHGPLTSPGQMTVHYAPRTRALRVDGVEDLAGFAWPPRAALLVVGRHELPPLPGDLHLYDLESPEAAARDLYAVLHQCDARQLELIVVLPPPDRPEWAAIRDRLRRATVPA